MSDIYSSQIYEINSYENLIKKVENNKTRNIGNANPKDNINKYSRLYEVCIEFEAIFLKQMLNVMRKSVPKSKFINGGFAEEIFEDMLYDEYSLKMAKNADFGMADMLYLEFLRAGAVNRENTQDSSLNHAT